MITVKILSKYYALEKEIYPENWDSIATEIKNKFKWRCALCLKDCSNRKPKSMADVLTVHHIDENPKNCSDNNLIAFCASCHLKIEPEARTVAENKGKQLLLFPVSEVEDYFASMERLRTNGLKQAQKQIKKL